MNMSIESPNPFEAAFPFFLWFVLPPFSRRPVGVVLPVFSYGKNQKKEMTSEQVTEATAIRVMHGDTEISGHTVRMENDKKSKKGEA